MFLKQYNYKPRSGSQSSGTEAEPSKTEQAAAQNATQQTGAISAAVAGRRRSSATEGQFAGLQGYKRKSEDGKRPNMNDQSAGTPGVLGQMWSNFTKGKE